MAMPWSPEWQVILTSMHMSLPDEARPTITPALAQTSFNWERFTTRACAHGVAPLLYAHPHKLGVVDHLPPRVRAVLQSAYYRNAARNTRLFRVVAEVWQACHRQGIAVIVLKGAALAETVYPHRAVRPMSDIDLLVRAEALEAMDESLTASGYRFVDHGRPKTYWRTQHYHLTFQPPPAAPLAVLIECTGRLSAPAARFAWTSTGCGNGPCRPPSLGLKPASSRLKISCSTCVCTCVSMPVCLPRMAGYPGGYAPSAI
jgi:Uncharacterised nucleotidyltransferase